MTFGEKLRLFREQTGLSQKELALSLQVTTGTVAEWEAEESQPPLSLLSPISNLLSVEIRNLLQEDHTSNVTGLPFFSEKDWTVAALAEEWLRLQKSRIKPSTYQRYVCYCRLHISPHIGHLSVISLSTVLLHEFAEARSAAGLAPRTVNAILVMLHSVLKYGNRQYHLPMVEIVYPSVRKKEMRVLSPEEESHLVALLLEDMDTCKLGVLIALYTGLRVGELCALKWRDLEGDCIQVRSTMQRIQKEGLQGTKIIEVEPKTASSARCIPLPAFLLTYLQAFRGNKSIYILGSEKTPVVEPRVMQYAFQRYLKILGIEGATFHTLRHTFATRCVERGFDIKTLSEILGHSNISITLNLYVHASLTFKRSNMQKVCLAT